VRLLSLGLVAAASLASLPAIAQTSDLFVTIYNDDMALVRDAREISFVEGRSVVEFENVSASILPQTVALTATDVTVLEQNFDYDLLTPAKLLEKAVGQRIRIVRTNPGNGAETSEIAEVLSVNDGAVLRIGDRIEVLRDDGLPTRLIFDGVPPNLRARPTLSVDLQTGTSGTRQTELRYLTAGLHWEADYVGIFDEAGGRLDLQAWITLRNTSGTAYPNARTRLVAGRLNLQPANFGQQRRRGAIRTAGTEPTGQQSLADYYLYDLPQATTIANRQNKQVAFADVAGIPASKSYRYVASGFGNMLEPESALISIEFSNSKASGIGIPLPAGIVRMYARDTANKAQFIGEDHLEHSPAGSQLAFDIGEAFDVTAQATVLEQSPGSFLNDGFVRMRYVFRNARKEPAHVLFEQSGLDRDWTLNEASQPGRERDAFTLQWDIEVPANGETTLTFQVDRN
jgi:hypothetical protein